MRLSSPVIPSTSVALLIPSLSMMPTSVAATTAASVLEAKGATPESMLEASELIAASSEARSREEGEGRVLIEGLERRMIAC